MRTLSGWFGSGIVSYPLWCPVDRPCPLDCFSAYQFWPFVAIHAGLFYGSAFGVLLLKRAGMWPEQATLKHRDGKFDSAYYVAWHVPMAVMAVPLSAIALGGAWEAWVSGTPSMYGKNSSALVSEACVWFSCFLALDTVLALVHGLGDRSLYAHHCIFGVACVLFSSRCGPAFTGCMLIAQEFSTPMLNAFILLRVYKGLDSTLTQAVFLLFALLFFIFRVFANTVVTVMFLRQVYLSTIHGDSSLALSLLEQVMSSAVVVGGTAMQLSWGLMIAKKIFNAVRGSAKDE